MKLGGMIQAPKCFSFYINNWWPAWGSRLLLCHGLLRKMNRKWGPVLFRGNGVSLPRSDPRI